MATRPNPLLTRSAPGWLATGPGSGHCLTAFAVLMVEGFLAMEDSAHMAAEAVKAPQGIHWLLQILRLHPHSGVRTVALLCVQSKFHFHFAAALGTVAPVPLCLAWRERNRD